MQLHGEYGAAVAGTEHDPVAVTQGGPAPPALDARDLDRSLRGGLLPRGDLPAVVAQLAVAQVHHHHALAWGGAPVAQEEAVLAADGLVGEVEVGGELQRLRRAGAAAEVELGGADRVADSGVGDVDEDAPGPATRHAIIRETAISVAPIGIDEDAPGPGTRMLIILELHHGVNVLAVSLVLVGIISGIQ